MKDKRDRKVTNLLLQGIYALGRSTVSATSRIGVYEPEEDYEAYLAMIRKGKGG